jgi:hypothetical protein
VNELGEKTTSERRVSLSLAREKVFYRGENIMKSICAAAVCAIALLSDGTFSVAEGGQENKSASPAGSSSWVAPRTPWGHPDLQGIWDTATGIPMERAKELGGKAELAPAEVAAQRKEAATRRKATEATNTAVRESPAVAGQLTTVQLASIIGPSVDFNPGLPDNRPVSARTSLIVDPPDGRIPALTPEALNRLHQREAARSHRGEGDSWEDRNSWERCITRTLPLGMLSTYNSNYQILQTPEYVAILVEMIHESRIIPLDGRPHLRSGLLQWLGDSRGHWEGDTLVVETTNFVPKLDGGTILPSHPNIVFTHRGSGETLTLVERFTRVDAHTINYQFTLVDPKTYTKPWTASVPMRNDGTPKTIFEYACHEGNVAMPNLLRSARANEAGALEAAQMEARERIAAGQAGVSLR